MKKKHWKRLYAKNGTFEIIIAVHVNSLPTLFSKLNLGICINLLDYESGFCSFWPKIIENNVKKHTISVINHLFSIIIQDIFFDYFDHMKISAILSKFFLSHIYFSCASLFFMRMFQSIPRQNICFSERSVETKILECVSLSGAETHLIKSSSFVKFWKKLFDF